MNINSLSLRDFRSYKAGHFSFAPGVNVIYGDNGKGKTNMIEAIYLLSGRKSWRATKKKELVLWDCEKAKIQAEVFARERNHQIELEIPVLGRTTALVNKVKIRSQQQLSDTLNCIIFSPDDLHIVKGGASLRRDFMDEAICQLRPKYADLISRYRKLIDSKNKLLKIAIEQKKALDIIPEYNAQLAVIGSLIIGYRDNFCTALNKEASALHSDISAGKENLFLSYKTVSGVKDCSAGAKVIEGWLLEHLESHKIAEVQSMQCLSGCHRDDIEIEINGRSARAFASQGQTRSSAISLKFGERELLKRDRGEYPVLLLDDVLSELDGPRQDFVSCHAMGGQTIITCCDHRDFSDANLITVK